MNLKQSFILFLRSSQDQLRRRRSSPRGARSWKSYLQFSSQNGSKRLGKCENAQRNLILERTDTVPDTSSSLHCRQREQRGRCKTHNKCEMPNQKSNIARNSKYGTMIAPWVHKPETALAPTHVGFLGNQIVGCVHAISEFHIFHTGARLTALCTADGERVTLSF